MADLNIAGTLTRHAQERIFERSRLTPIEVQQMLDAHQFCWTTKPKAGQDAYAVVFDAVAQDYLVAIVQHDSRNVKTVLTLEQYEESKQLVSDNIKLLARLALLSKEEQKAATGDAKQEYRPPASWRFNVLDAKGKLTSLGQLDYWQILDMFFCKPVETASNLRKRALHLIKTRAFFVWFFQALERASVDVESVRNFVVEAVHPETDEAFCRTDITEHFVRVLTNPVPEALDGFARHVSDRARLKAKRLGTYSTYRNRRRFERYIERQNAL
jgi:hypothetical protein